MQDRGFFKPPASGGPVVVHLLLVPNFSMNAFTCMVEPMRLANFIAGKEIYRWEIISRDGDAVTASNHIMINAEKDLVSIERPDNITVCSGVDAHLYNDTASFGFLRRWNREGAHIGSLCTGAHILAHAGLLNGFRCTVHWSNLDSMIEEFPDLDIRAELFEIDRNRFTCAGGMASLDLILHDIRHRVTPDLAAAVSEQFMHERIREGHENQKLPLQARLRINHPRLIKAIAEMEAHVEEALSRDEIASHVGLSRRQLERLFRRYLGTSPARYYLKLRLNRAQTLLQQTTMPVTEVAFASGFTSASHFSKCYRDMFGKTPRGERHGGDLDNYEG
jgi:transcriptional regulator GlxA family with amidase domain